MHDQPAMDRHAGPQFPPPAPAPARHACFTLRSAASLLAVVLLAGNLSGCKIVLGVMQILQGFPKNDCDFGKFTKRDLAEKGKKVVVLCSSSGAAQAEEPSLDVSLIGEISRRLKMEHVSVVDPHLVGNWIDDNGEITENTRLEPIGEHFHADYILLIRFESFGYHEDNSHDLYRGHAEGHVVVAEMVPAGGASKEKIAKIIYHKPFDCKYPANQPIATSADEGPDSFKLKFMARLSNTLSWLFYDHRLEDEI